MYSLLLFLCSYFLRKESVWFEKTGDVVIEKYMSVCLPREIVAIFLCICSTTTYAVNVNNFAMQLHTIK